MKHTFFYWVLASLSLVGCTPYTTTVLIPDRYLEDCHETAPLTIDEYLALGTYEEKEISLFKQNTALRGDIKECNARLKAARHIQTQAKSKIKK